MLKQVQHDGPIMMTPFHPTAALLDREGGCQQPVGNRAPIAVTGATKGSAWQMPLQRPSQPPVWALV